MRIVNNRWMLPIAAAAMVLVMGIWSRSPAAGTAPTAAGDIDSTNWLLRLHDQPLSLDLSNGKTLEGTFISTLYVNAEDYFLGIKTANSANPTFVNIRQIVAFHQMK